MTTHWVPETCTLPAYDQPLRLAEWDALFAARVNGVTRTKATLVELTLSSTDGVAELAAKETDCCSFFDFTLTGDRLRIGVPAAHADLLDALATRAEAACA